MVCVTAFLIIFLTPCLCKPPKERQRDHGWKSDSRETEVAPRDRGWRKGNQVKDVVTRAIERQWSGCTYTGEATSDCVNGEQEWFWTKLPQEQQSRWWCPFLTSTRTTTESCTESTSTTTTSTTTTTPTTTTTTEPTSTTTTSTTTTTPTTTTTTEPTSTTTTSTTTTTPTTTTTTETTSTTTTTTTTTTTPAPVQSDCGVVNTPSKLRRFLRSIGDPVNIVGGTNSVECKYPWIARLHIGPYLCGGALISDRHVLTAAHCTDGFRARRTTVWLGEYDTGSTSGYEVSASASQLIEYPSYNSNTYEHDLAIIELQSSVSFTSCISPICLPDSDYAWASGTEICTVAGWGTLQYGGSLPDVLQEVDVTLWSAPHCLSEFSSMPSTGLVHDNTVCAGEQEGGRDSCQGDSGGPLMCEINGLEYFTGIVSTGWGCAYAGYPGVYTRVAAPAYRSWIESVITQ